jgi:hypothetical protein
LALFTFGAFTVWGFTFSTFALAGGAGMAESFCEATAAGACISFVSSSCRRAVVAVLAQAAAKAGHKGLDALQSLQPTGRHEVRRGLGTPRVCFHEIDGGGGSICPIHATVCGR